MVLTPYPPDGFALMFTALITIAKDGTWSASNGIVYVVFMVCTLTHGLLATTMTKIMNKMQTFAVALVGLFSKAAKANDCHHDLND